MRSTHPAWPGYVDLLASQDGEQRLLEQVGPVDRAVGLLQLRESVLLEVEEVPRVLLNGPSRVLEVGSIFGHGLANFLSTDLVEGVMGQPLDVEAVEDD